MNGIVDTKNANPNQRFAMTGMTRNCNRTISGVIVGCARCVGYCHFSGHPGFLTEKQRKQHNCLGKACNYYVAKQQKAQRAKPEKEQKDVLIGAIMQKSSAICDAVKILDVKKEQDNSYRVYYVSITNDFPFFSCAKNLQKEYGIHVEYFRLDYDFDICVRLICRE